MRNKCVQMSLEGIYNDVSKSMEDKKPALIKLLETHKYSMILLTNPSGNRRQYIAVPSKYAVDFPLFQGRG